MTALFRARRRLDDLRPLARRGDGGPACAPGPVTEGGYAAVGRARASQPLDPRAWLLWGVAASLPALVGRNPFVLAATLAAVLSVRVAWAASAPRAAMWNGIVRLAAVFAAIGALFNVLTVHLGDRALARLPDGWPIVGGVLTFNALAYGILAGFAILTLVLVGTTVGALLDWPALLRLLPPRLTTVAVAASVAWAFVPQTAAAFREIREAQAARGYQATGARGIVPLLVPLLAGGLERAIMLAEALEARGFGAPLGAQPAAPDRIWRAIVTALGLAAGAAGGYLLAVGRPTTALPTLGLAGLALAVAGREPGGGAPAGRRTRYRTVRWERADTAVALAAGTALAAVSLAVALDPLALRWEPYPALTWPRASLPLLAALALLLAPALVAPVGVGREAGETAAVAGLGRAGFGMAGGGDTSPVDPLAPWGPAVVGRNGPRDSTAHAPASLSDWRVVAAEADRIGSPPRGPDRGDPRTRPVPAADTQGAPDRNLRLPTADSPDADPCLPPAPGRNLAAVSAAGSPRP